MDDERYYQIVADELRANRINDALWTKAIAKSMGDENKTKALYIQLRVEQIMQEEKRARMERASGSMSDEDIAEEAGANLEEARSKKTATLIGQIIVFIVGVCLIYFFLYPWLRSLKQRLAE